jgi:hypothetical protein
LSVRSILDATFRAKLLRLLLRATARSYSHWAYGLRHRFYALHQEKRVGMRGSTNPTVFDWSAPDRGPRESTRREG